MFIIRHKSTRMTQIIRIYADLLIINDLRKSF
jgi:hypothetical protein